jgi:hypothetical protein
MKSFQVDSVALHVFDLHEEHASRDILFGHQDAIAYWPSRAGQLLQAGHCPSRRESRQVCSDGRGRFFVLATALPVLAALGEDASEQGFAVFKFRFTVSGFGEFGLGGN